MRAAAKAKLQSLPADAKDDTAATDLLDVAAEYAAVSADGRRVAYRKGNQLSVVAGDTGKTLRTWPLSGAGFRGVGRRTENAWRSAGAGATIRWGCGCSTPSRDGPCEWPKGLARCPRGRPMGRNWPVPSSWAKSPRFGAVPVKQLATLPPWAPATDRCGVPEAAADLVGPWHCPKGNLVQLDLGAHANQKRGDKFSPTAGNDLQELPEGEQTLAGVKLRVADRVIQLAGTRLPEAPPRVEGIPVQRRANRLYILQGTQWGGTQFGVPDGTPIGTLPHSLCRRLPRHDPDRLRRSTCATGGAARASTASPTDKSRGWDAMRPRKRSNVYLRLYLTVWENPHPEKTVAHLDFSSTMTAAAPFCVAITAEEPGN